MADTLEAAITARRDAKGWTLEQFAAVAGISVSGLRKVLRAQVDVLQSPTVNGLATALGVKPPRVRVLYAASLAAAGK